MTRIVVKKIIWDEYNSEHIKKHNVSKQEVEEVGKKFLYHRKTHTGRYLAIGRTGSRIITLVIRRVRAGLYYLTTARDSSKKERRDLYVKESKKEIS